MQASSIESGTRDTKNEKGMGVMVENRMEEKIEELLKEMTLEEKIGMIHGNGLFRTQGVERLGIPPLKMSDGPMGVRHEFENSTWRNVGLTDDYVTYLPSNSALASTWNKELAHETGLVLGEEARGRGKDVILAPGINVMRSPLCGRNFEYMSEDPHLIEEMAVPLIKGVQEHDVAACVKHFACNSQETNRLWVDTFVSERALRELYFPGFYAAVTKGKSYSLMGAYNLLHGEHCCQSKSLLNGVLREEWKYDGTIISDWGAVHDTKTAAESALDIEMSVTSNFDDYFMANPLVRAIDKGEVSETVVDEKVRNILRMMFRLRMIGEEANDRRAGTYNTFAHQEAVLNVAREAIVLLKNEEERLPIKQQGLKKIALIGQNAEVIHSNGGGSAEIKALYEISPLMGVKKLLGGNTEVSYAKGYYIPSKEEQGDVNWQESSLESKEATSLSDKERNEKEEIEQRVREEIRQQGKKLREEAIALAKSVDEVIFIGGLNHDYDVEGLDRDTFALPYEQEALIDSILEVNPNAVIVIIAGSPVRMRSFAQKAKAIVWSSYNGMQGGTALAEVLFGNVNPSGHLPMTIPKELEESPAHKLGEFATKDRVTYKEGIYVGYRYNETYDVEPEFCFGHGLSYTNFVIESMEVIKEETDADLVVSVQVKVKNTGACFGATTLQLYVSDKEASKERPSIELKAFEKVFLQPGETKSIIMQLREEAFAFYHEEMKAFVVEDGEFSILCGFSSRDIKIEQSLEVTQTYQYVW